MDKSLIEEEEEESSPRHQITATERTIINKCIDAVEARSASLEAKGMTKGNFVFGVSNSLFVAWSFGSLPEHFWIIYLLEVALLFPIRWVHQVRARPLKQHLYWLDFCWVANFAAIAFLAVLVLIPDLDEEIRKRTFAAAWAVSNGPLLLATGLLGNALIFHDLDNTSSVLIHLFPSLVMFEAGWHHDLLHAAWPGIFKINYFEQLDPLHDIYYNGALGYTVWLLAYTAWLVCCGMKAPSAGYDTIFHCNMRGAAGNVVSKCVGRSKEEHARRAKDNDFKVSDAVVYMSIHAVMCYAAISVSLLCFLNKWIHTGLCGAMTFMTIYNAASRYTFYMLKSYGQVIRQQLGIPLNRKASAIVSLEI
eukprot:TRINITY_DN34418_c0_g2_i1.p1 TRINITY_DN34418_c0_g2~~TRINITY_DN34418_c0_g2_i1.p1  ORF type:complete len:363 (-),score=71.02 TRINITY_DN34418_c0_g2_i1:150-1238(-)